MRIPRIMKASLVAFTLLSPATVSAQATSTTNTISTSIAATSTTDFILPTVTSSAPTVPTPAPAPTPSAGNSTLKTCPGPLINNTFGLNIPTCMGPCCIKCPAVNSFYEPNKVERVMNAAYVTRQVSMALSIFIAFSYMLLPGKRSQPHISVLFLSVSLSLWYISFDIMPGVSNACINEFEQSTGHNSKLCGVQGVLIIYFTQTSSLWCSLLIYKLHLLAVWRSDFVDRHYGWLTSFCWIFPLAFAIPVAVMNLSQYPGIGFSCLVSTANLNTYLFYPLAVYIYPAMLCHTVTVAKMIHLAILSSNIDTGLSQLSSSARMKITTTMQAKRLLRGQWRPALMVGTAMTSMLIFWLFYFVDAHRLADLGPTTPWIQQWVICVMTNGAKGLTSDETQTLCSKEISSNLPSIPWLTAAELVLALVGTVVALVFISKAEFWSDWAFLLSNIFRRGKLGHGSRGHGSPDGNLPNNAEHTARYNYNGSPLKKGTRVGYNDVLPGEFKNEHNPIVRREHQEGTQWYDMDDLLDKEYDLQGAELQRNMSYGSRTAMTSACGHQSSTQLPQYPSSSIQDPHSGDILYAPPVQESVNNNAWSSAAHSAVSPAETYLVANDNSDQYVDRPFITFVDFSPKISFTDAPEGPWQNFVHFITKAHSTGLGPDRERRLGITSDHLCAILSNGSVSIFINTKGNALRSERYPSWMIIFQEMEREQIGSVNRMRRLESDLSHVKENASEKNSISGSASKESLRLWMQTLRDLTEAAISGLLQLLLFTPRLPLHA
ncbi:hypothetical protein BC939DRAFT_477949 [Gamsiella multidivaricata]|uniref:uncharacterized protein n=1 Tax=Gamsiella multidivaricata TaxID=101098 RepID=UPI0022206A8A|nr:uncharacterized protein BC939DRAFT_477949 [Gamsiella multidivaricata]KAI7822221.1 hypothetical protein BC939DRAFT_477949 [Gamsiella multidivaricata]